MALIKCNKCGKEISDKAKKCIHCNCPIKNENKKRKNTRYLIFGIIIFIFVILIVKATNVLLYGLDYKEDISSINNKNSKQKVINYLVENKNATCNDNKCSYTSIFDFYGMGEIFYTYTIDFENKKFYREQDGLYFYVEYNYLNKKGYVKYTYKDTNGTNTDITDVLFNDDDTYTWKCETNLREECQYIENNINAVINTKKELLTIVNDLEVNILDL